MDNFSPESNTYYETPETQKGTSYRGRAYWQKAEEILLAELYTDFMPRWFKKQTKVRDYKTKAAVGWGSPAIKLAIGVGLSPVLMTSNLGEYETAVVGLCLYLVADSIYQLFDLRHPYHDDLRRAATLGLDLLSYPIYLIWSKTHYGYASKSQRRGSKSEQP